MVTGTLESRLSAFAEIAVTSERMTHFPAELECAQWAIESKWGQRHTGKNNVMGLTAAWSSGPSSFVPTFEEFTWAQFLLFERTNPSEARTAREMDGSPLRRNWLGEKRFRCSRLFRDYPSIEACVADKVQKLTSASGRYSLGWAAFLATGDAFALADAIARAGYASDSTYGNLVKTIMRQNNVRSACAAARRNQKTVPYSPGEVQ